MSGGGENSKTVKAALKEARELIEKKDYKAALRCCKRALNVDKNNYMALVFCGLCLGELDQQDQAVQVIKLTTQLTNPGFARAKNVQKNLNSPPPPRSTPTDSNYIWGCTLVVNFFTGVSKSGTK